MKKSEMKRMAHIDPTNLIRRVQIREKQVEVLNKAIREIATTRSEEIESLRFIAFEAITFFNRFENNIKELDGIKTQKK